MIIQLNGHTYTLTYAPDSYDVTEINFSGPMTAQIDNGTIIQSGTPTASDYGWILGAKNGAILLMRGSSGLTIDANSKHMRGCIDVQDSYYRQWGSPTFSNTANLTFGVINIRSFIGVSGNSTPSLKLLGGLFVGHDGKIYTSGGTITPTP